jgi:hypothetical protein
VKPRLAWREREEWRERRSVGEEEKDERKESGFYLGMVIWRKERTYRNYRKKGRREGTMGRREGTIERKE